VIGLTRVFRHKSAAAAELMSATDSDLMSPIPISCRPPHEGVALPGRWAGLRSPFRQGRARVFAASDAGTPVNAAPGFEESRLQELEILALRPE
jgi:hypothetical protein